VGPDYEEPKTQPTDRFQNAAEDPYRPGPVEVTWWKQFREPALDLLIDRALARNLTLQGAAARIQLARAILAGNQFDLLPVLQAQASYTRELTSSASSPFPITRSERTLNLYSAGFDATWEIDLFGRVRRSIEATQAEVDASIFSRRDAVVSLLGEVALNYFSLRGARNQLSVSRRNADVQAETLRLTTSLFQGGRGTQLDVARARSQLNSTLAVIPAFEIQEVQFRNRLAVLLGEEPERFTLDAPGPGRMGPLPALVAVGRPEELLRRRPDIRVAERHLASATALIGVATADLFPRLSLNGTFGPTATTIPGLAQPVNAAWSYGPSLTWAALDLGHVAARIRAAGAQADANLADYKLAVLLALEDAENSLVGFNRERLRRDTLQAAVQASEEASSLAQIRYQNGAADFLTVLDAQRTQLAQELQLAESETRTVTALVAVYKALGGGWEYEEERSAPASSP
jgi:multidrug efflux system outer membrane protein